MLKNEDDLRELIDKQMKNYDFEDCYVHITNSIKVLGAINITEGQKKLHVLDFLANLLKLNQVWLKTPFYMKLHMGLMLKGEDVLIMDLNGNRFV